MAVIEASREIWHRDDFPLLCNWRGLWRACEVGVDRAEWAQLFLSRWLGSEWWGVDDYQPYPEMPYDRHTDYLLAVERLAPHANRAKILKHSSAVASQFFPAGSLDFVYLDGAHDYANVSQDISLWFPKLAAGGILAGHDWTDQPHHKGIRQAVCEFADQIDRPVYLTAVEGFNKETCPSWYIYRDGMPGPEWRRC